MSRHDASSVVTTYVTAWTSGDFDTARSTLHDDVLFVGPLGTADGVDDCMRGLRGLKQIVESSEQRKVFADGDDVCLVYDIITNTPPAPSPPPVGSSCETARSWRSGCTSTPGPSSPPDSPWLSRSRPGR